MSLRDIYDDLPIGVCILKRDRKDMSILYANMVMESMMELHAGESITGRKFIDVWPGAEAAQFVKQLMGTIPPGSCILPVQALTGDRRRWIKLDVTRDLWEGQDCFTFWATDISSSKKAEERLQEAVQEADASAEMKSNFLATMSHEIRTPMQTVYGLLELIVDESRDEKITSMANIAQNSASGLLEILDDVLDLAKADAGKMELDIFEVPVRLLVRGLLEALSVKIHGKDVDLIDDIEDDVPFVVIGDPKRLRQIIMNLCGNAMKFTHEGSVVVRVTTKTQHIAPSEDYIALRFEITDTGIGMSQEVCDQLFGSFTQADNSTSRKYGGTGLGLSISKKLVELMDGKIGVESVEGQGSVFWFEIPTEEVSADTTTVELPELDGISVLSVEDHPQGAQEIVSSLRSMGASVESCATYEEGLELARRRPFDVGVIDQGLPDGLGLDLIKDIMEIRPNMGLVMYTVRDDVGLSHSLQALGVTYLPKPASRAGLGEAVRDATSKVVKIDQDGPTRLLIAEDTEIVRDVLRRQLDKLGVEADFAENGREALEALRGGEYGILITDLHMPEVDGYQVAQEIREQERQSDDDRHFPVIVLTADVQISHRDFYMRHGFDECLLKPVSLGQFKRLLIRWGLLDEEMGIGGSAPAEKSVVELEVPPIENGEEELPPAIDREAIIAQMGALDAGAIEMLGMFIDMTEPLIGKLHDAKEARNFHVLQETAHSLKGGARSACCNVLGDLAAHLQERSEADEFAPELVDKIEIEFERVRKAIAAL